MAVKIKYRKYKEKKIRPTTRAVIDKSKLLKYKYDRLGSNGPSGMKIDKQKFKDRNYYKPAA